jgi:UDP-N-acetylglucosamine--N-acetylmuramyl-(pentapeptide) pyrophosphoryl-undecaprenol N-acetylglucosamine transferase
MPVALAAADVVISRAGATSIAEITLLGRPAVLVPYPYATDDHQTTNARALIERGAAVMVPDDELDTPRLGDEVMRLLEDPGLRASMAAASREMGRPDAAARLIAIARDAARDTSRTNTGRSRP